MTEPERLALFTALMQKTDGTVWPDNICALIVATVRALQKAGYLPVVEEVKP